MFSSNVMHVKAQLTGIWMKNIRFVVRQETVRVTKEWKGWDNVDVYVVCDKCNTAKPEETSSYYYDDDGFVATICFACQPSTS